MAQATVAVGGDAEFYPSVERGPVSIARALQWLAWRPAPLHHVLRDACAFNTQLLRARAGDALSAARELLRDLGVTHISAQELVEAAAL